MVDETEARLTKATGTMAELSAELAGEAAS